MAVHSGAGVREGTLADWVVSYLGSRAVRNGFTASPVHRLDRETSGVIVIAKRRPAMVRLTDAFAKGLVRKRYLALAKGDPANDRGVFDQPLDDLSKAAGHPQPARTEYLVVERLTDAALVECSPRTGRTHQIRRHFAMGGHPLAGDTRYGDPAFNRHCLSQWGMSRLFLHAASLELPHPRDGVVLRVESPLAADLAEVLRRARTST